MKLPIHTKDEHPQPVVAFGIVVYREVFCQTEAFVSLVRSAKVANHTRQYAIFIYDNTDLADWNIEYNHAGTDINVHYYHDRQNSGISIAYNHLAKAAQEKGYSWIVFLDQDTELPVEAVAVYKAAIVQQPDIPVKTIVLLVNGKIFSPSKFFLKGGRSIRSIEAGIHSFNKLVFVNSGMMVRLTFFFQAGGYDERVKLDFADFLFLDRVKLLTSFFQLLPVTGKHSFSINEKDITKALRRYAIFITDLAHCPRTTLSDVFAYSFVGWKHLLRLTINFQTLRFLLLRFRFKK